MFTSLENYDSTEFISMKCDLCQDSTIHLPPKGFTIQEDPISWRLCLSVGLRCSLGWCEDGVQLCSWARVEREFSQLRRNERAGGQPPAFDPAHNHTSSTNPFKCPVYDTRIKNGNTKFETNLQGFF